MRLREEYLISELDGEALLVPTGEADFNGLVKGNKSVGVILNCLMQDTTEAQILVTMQERFDGDEEAMKADIADVIGQLRTIGAIDG